MATGYVENVFVNSPTLLDAKQGPFNSVGEAQLAVPIEARSIGLFHFIITPIGAKLYWYKNNIVDLVPFTGNSSVEVYDTFADFPLVADASQDVIYIAKDTATSYYFNSTTDEYVPFEGESSVEVYPAKTGSTPGTDSFPTIGTINVIYVADDTNISYIWNQTLLNGAGDYEVITGTGKSILSIERTSGDGSPGTTDVYTITYSDITTYDFSIYNGNDGVDGTDGSPGLVYLGNYILGNGYIANIAVVKGSDNNLYIAKASGGLADPVGNTAEWDIFLPKGADGINGIDGDDALWNFTGAYGGGTAYAVGDIATFEGETWYRINSNGGNVGDTPAEGIFWTKIAAKGADGDGSGTTPTLQEVLTEGNTATDINIELIGTSKIQFENTSKLQKGTTDSGIGGNGGVALKCSIEYELKWEAGRLYIMQQDGIGIREVRYTLTVIPTVNDDDTKGFAVGSRWILDNGETWVCSDNSTGAAVWNIEATGGGISYYTASGAGTYTVGGITTYNTGDTYLINFTDANAGASTLNGYTLVNSKTQNNLLSGDIRINETHLIVFDDDDLFQVLTIGPNSSLNPEGGGGGSGAIVDMGDRLDGLELVDMGSRI